MMVALPASVSARLFPFVPACPGQYSRRSFRRWMSTIDTFRSWLPIPLFTLPQGDFNRLVCEHCPRQGVNSLFLSSVLGGGGVGGSNKGRGEAGGRGAGGLFLNVLLFLDHHRHENDIIISLSLTCSHFSPITSVVTMLLFQHTVKVRRVDR